MNKKDFIAEIRNAMKNKPAHWRNGQAVFNYIDSTYGIARRVQFEKHVDCFHDDSKIEQFIDAVWDLLNSPDPHDFPGDNMIEE